MKNLFFLSVCLLFTIATNAQKQLWGMSATNGAINGTIFKTDSAGNGYTDVYTFADPVDGVDPYGSLMQATNGKLYGLTSRGGINDFGVLFQVDPATGAYAKVHDFDSVEGKTPLGSLVQASNGRMYGMTYGGGSFALAPNKGVLFEFEPATNAFTKKIDFHMSNGAYPYGSMIAGYDGMLYGLASAGGVDATGVLFQFNFTTGVTVNKGSFIAGPAWEGQAPRGSVVAATDSTFYGFARYGMGSGSGGGVIFKYDPAAIVTTVMSSLHRFNETPPDSIDGYELMGSPIIAANGKLYGMTQKGGVNGAGTIFEYDLVSGTFSKLYDFNGTTEGYLPYGSLLQGPDGKIYGLTTSEGGQARLFRFDIATNTLVVTADVTGTPYYTSLIEVVTAPATKLPLLPGDEIRLYPTPAINVIHIDLPAGYKCDELVVVDITGKVVKRLPGDLTTIDVAALPAGSYFLQAFDGEKRLHGRLLKK